MPTLADHRAELEAGAVTAEELVARCVAAARDPEGEGERVFVTLYETEALARARQIDRQRAAGEAPSPWAGIPISVKDLFDRAGEVTRAGSMILADAPPARQTAPAIARLEAAGLVPIGRTNMTEFAYSGVGLNPHYGTPRNPFDRALGRIPGGSSSGAAVSVSDGMAAAGIGTDTGGSCRIPAALCGIVGYKPTARRIPLTGVYPLAESLDSVGSLASSVDCCAVLDAIMAGEAEAVDLLPARPELAGVSLAVLDHYATADLDPEVARAWQGALDALDRAGARLSRVRLPELEELPRLNAGGGIAAAEAFRHHRRQLDAHAAGYDPRVASRIGAGAGVTAEQLAAIRSARAALIERFAALLDGFAALLMPTVPIVAPPLAAFASDEDYVRLNLLLLRNPSLVNFLDGCAVSVPIEPPGTAPVGLMLAAPGGSDARLLGVAAAVEELFPRRA
jgi:aspartyl-tRNA(Asn)/glutamyl-tRNA(Gln) amidotransferase subunit A